MGEYSITFARSAGKELEALTPPIVGKVFAKIEVDIITIRHRSAAYE